MSNIRKRTNKDGVTTYQIRVFRGNAPDGTQLKPYTMTYKPREGMTEKQIAKELNKTATLFEEQCRKGFVATEHKTFAEYADYVIEVKEKNGLKHTTVRSCKIDCVNSKGMIE